MLDPSTPVATIVLDHSATASVFARHRIDYCCKGERPLADACRALGLDLQQIINELESEIAQREPSRIDPRALSTREIIVKLIAPHHQYLHRALPFLQALAAKVARVHGEREPSLRQLASQVDTLASTLQAHLADEESQLFPVLLGLRLGDVAPMLHGMRAEHEQVGTMLALLRQVARDYEAPAWACNSYRTLLGELAQLERDTLEHVHIENHVLAARMLATA